MENVIANTDTESAEHRLAHVASNDVEWDMPHDVGDAPATPDDDAPDDDAPATPDDDAPADSYSGYGSGEDDLADYNQNEASDYING